MGTVLVVDDEERMRSMLCRLLAEDGHATLVAADGQSALQCLAESEVDLILLDLVMPNANGLQVLSALRRQGVTIPAIVISAVPDVAARVQAFEAGAVDFVPKPFHPAELAARVRRTLAHHDVRVAEQQYLQRGALRLDLDRRRALFNGETVPLSGREFELLAHLMRRSGHVCGREELLHDVWGLAFDPGTNVVEVCVRRLRSKLRGIPIETVRSVGYCLVER